MIRSYDVDVTRPATTPTYTAGDVVGPTAGDAAEFRLGEIQSGRIRGALLIDSAAEATKPDLDLVLFDKEPTVAADDAEFAATDAEVKRCVGVITFAGSTFKVLDVGGNGVIQVTGLDIPFNAPERKLYGVLVARNAYVAVASEVFTVRLAIESS